MLKALSTIGVSSALIYGLDFKKAKCWIYRDDIGAWWGIKGYEEMVTEVGTHHGHYKFP